MEDEYKKCKLCGRRFRVQDWKVGIERNVNLLCRSKLEVMPPRYAKVLIMRFGLADGITHTLEEVGREFGVTRERIRQIEARALEIIKM